MREKLTLLLQNLKDDRTLLVGITDDKDCPKNLKYSQFDLDGLIDRVELAIFRLPRED